MNIKVHKTVPLCGKNRPIRLKTTLDQWLTLFEVDRAGSIQAAAVKLNKSHTTLIYSLRKLEDQLGVSLVEIKGRRAVLTDSGKSLLRRADSMLEQARELEEISVQLAQGIESKITVAIDHLCDRQWLYQPMSHYLTTNSSTSIQIIETSLSKTTDMVESQQADIAIITLPITNYSSEAFGITTMLPVISAQHPLAQKQPLHLSDFTTISQIVVRDLGEETTKDVGWLKARQRITVDNFDHAWEAVKQGVGFCRLPEHLIINKNDNTVTTLNIENAQRYQVALHLTLPKGAKTGPAAQSLFQALINSAKLR